MVFEEVDLHGAVGQVHHLKIYIKKTSLNFTCAIAIKELYWSQIVGFGNYHSARGPEPGLESWNPRQCVLFTNLDGNEAQTSRVPKVPVLESYLHVCSGLQQVLLHVVAEVVQQLHLSLSHEHQI